MDAVLCELGFPEEIIMTVDVGSFFTQFGQVWVTGKVDTAPGTADGDPATGNRVAHRALERRATGRDLAQRRLARLAPGLWCAATAELTAPSRTFP